MRLRLAQASERIGDPHAADTRNVADLRAELRERGLPVSGRKETLRNRLAFADGLLPWQQQGSLKTVVIWARDGRQRGESVKR